MIDRYTKKAQQALSLAENTAEELGHNYIGTEHILVGLLEEGTGVAARLLEAYGVREDKVLDLIRRLIAPSNSVSIQEPQRYSPSASTVLENSFIEAKRFKSQLIGTEHILIAMLKRIDCSATRLLTTMEVNIRRLYVDLLVSIGQDAGSFKDEIPGNAKTARNNRTRTFPNMEGI